MIRVADVSRLPWAITEYWDWQRHAACRGMNQELFFHPDGERDPSRARRIAAAAEVCASCPVREPCREWAHQVHEPYGVWGGEGEDARRIALAAERRQAAGTG